MPSLLTLTTDFGLHDGYVAAMKGVILGIAPQATLVDISHEVPAHDVMAGAFLLRQAAFHFPPGTIHLAVVDPGVGTDRRAVALRYRNQLFVGPDNGLFALVLEGEAPQGLVMLDRPEVWRTPTPSRTFHGRDVFAPAAAHLAAGTPLDAVGSPLEALQRLHWAMPIADDQGVRGWVVHVDHFGNCVTNIQRSVLEEHRHGRPLKCIASGTILHALHDTYGQVPEGDPLLLYGSDDALEIAVRNGNASDLLGIRRGDPVQVIFRDDR